MRRGEFTSGQGARFRPALLLCLVLAAMLGGQGRAGGVTVSPTSLSLTPGERATQLTLGNSGDQAVTFDLSLLAWTQPGGQDLLAPTQAVVVAPAVVTLAPGQTQTVRLARLGAPPLEERAYRLLATQRPSAMAGVSTRLQLSLPLFDGPRSPGPAPAQVQATLTPAGALHLRNTGPQHLRLPDLQLRVGLTWQAVPLLYLLAGQGRDIDVTGVQELRFSTQEGAVQDLTPR